MKQARREALVASSKKPISRRPQPLANSSSLPRPRTASEAERGSGTVFVIGLLALAAIVIISLMSLGEGVALKQRLHNTADVAAIAGAQALQLAGPEVACQQAAHITQQNSGELQTCEIIGSHVRVTVVDHARVLPGVTLSATARAGPVDDPPS